MNTHLLIIMVIVLAAIGLLSLLLIKNQKDRKNLFKKLPEDYPDPKFVASEFDSEKDKRSET